MEDPFIREHIEGTIVQRHIYFISILILVEHSLHLRIS